MEKRGAKTGLSPKDITTIKTLNFVAQYDGIIEDKNEIIYILECGIEKLIAKRKRHLVSVDKTAYPIRIKYQRP